MLLINFIPFFRNQVWGKAVENILLYLKQRQYEVTKDNALIIWKEFITQKNTGLVCFSVDNFSL